MKKWILFTFLLALLLLTACDKIPFLGNGEEKAGDQRGVEVAIVAAPSGSLEEGEPFSVTTRVTNGNPTSDVVGSVCLSNPVSERLGGVTLGTCEPFALERAEKVENDLFPTQEEQFFGPFEYRNLDPDLTFTTNIAATFTYITQSRHFVSNVCVKRKSSLETPLGSNCDDSKSYSSIEQPKTPIRVSRIDRDVHYLPTNEVNLKVTILLEQTQAGDVVSRENIDQLVEINPLIDFSAEYLGQPLVCSGLEAGRVKMSQDRKEISCRATIAINQDYVQDPLVVNLAYGFRRVIQTDSIELLALDREFASLA